MTRTFRVLLGALLLLIATGCASMRLRDAIDTVNGAQIFLAAANATLSDAHRSARDAAVAAAPDEPAARKALATVHGRYLVGWQAYEAARFAWLGAASAVRAAQALDAAGGDYEPRDVGLALLELGAAYEAFRRAALTLRAQAPVLP